jgi:hypothetical protein
MNAGALPPSTAETEAQMLRPELPEAALYGLPGRVVRTLSPTSEADDAGLLLAFLVMFGNAVGPGPYVNTAGRQSCAEFLMLVGAQAMGRKDTALDAVQQIFTAFDTEWLARRNSIKAISSGQALVDRISEVTRGGHDGIAADPRLMFHPRELSSILSVMARSDALGTALISCWDGEPLAHTTQRRNVQVDVHHVSVVGGITLRKLGGDRHWLADAGGLESRFLYAMVAKQGDVNPARINPDPPPELVAETRQALENIWDRTLESTDVMSRALCELRGIQPWLDMNPPLQAGHPTGWLSDESMRKIKLTLLHLTQYMDEVGEGDELLNRGLQHVTRLALIYAIADGSAVIRPEHTKAALAVWTYCAKSARLIVAFAATPAPTHTAGQRRQVLHALARRNPDWLTKSEIYDVFNRNVRKDVIDTLLDELLGADIVEHRHQPGRPGAPKGTDEYRGKGGRS